MKIALLLLLLIPCSFGFANEIDQLRTTKDVLQFAKKVNPAFDTSKFQIRPTEVIAKDLECDGIFKEWDIQNWEKADLNNDGRTDLLIIAHFTAYNCYAIIDNGKGKFKVHEISRSHFEDCELKKPFKIRNKTYLKNYQKRLEISLSEEKEVILVDTLTFKHGEFIELNERRENYKIESIQIEQSCSEVFCPNFTLKINRRGETEYKAVPYHDNGKYMKQKSFKRKLPRAKFNEIAEMLTYMRLKDLKDYYVVPWMHKPTAILTIEFKNGEVKRIRDYGMEGTFGLKGVYTKLLEIGIKTE